MTKLDMTIRDNTEAMDDVTINLTATNRLLIIFDCDGVLVDSEPITNKVFWAMLHERGINITLEETVANFVGRTMKACAVIIKEKYGVEITADDLGEFAKRSAEILRKELLPVEGIHEVLKTIPYQYCVASSGSYDKMNITLSVTGIMPFVEGKIFSAVDVAHGKPSPDIFLHAAEKMGFSPDECIVVEDSPLGALAAKNAGMKCIGYSARTKPLLLAEHDAIVIHSMKELLPTIKEIWKAK
jgi:HAD superfamily hydrolase (TIGR01509 family)